VRYLEGRGLIDTPSEVRVDLAAGGSTTLNSKNVLISTGSRAGFPGLPGTAGKDLYTADTLWHLSQPPSSAVVVRGDAGYPIFACEVAFVLTLFNCDVTLIEQAPEFLPGEEPELAGRLRQLLEDAGVRLVTGAWPSGRTGAAVAISGAVEVAAEAIVIADCRMPFDGGCGIADLGAAYSEGALAVDENSRTNIAGVYAAGDCTGVGFSSKAATDGRRVANAVMGVPGELDDCPVPRAVSTTPALASVGMTESEASGAGYEVITGLVDTGSSVCGVAAGGMPGMVKIVSEAQLHQVLGVHILGPHAEELISQAALAMRLEATLEDLAATTSWHPTFSEHLGEAARRALRDS
jgi:dihydrolipoyl dehydrogenase